MAKITNLDDLKRMHDWARISKVGSKEWIDFSLTMIDSFPAIYDMAKDMNKRMTDMLDENERLRGYFEYDANCPCCQQSRECEKGCGFAEDAPGDYQKMVHAREILKPHTTGGLCHTGSK